MTPIQVKPPRSRPGDAARHITPPARPAAQLVLPGTLQPQKNHDWTGENPHRCARCGLARFKCSDGAPWRYRIGPGLSRRRPDCTPTTPTPLPEIDP